MKISTINVLELKLDKFKEELDAIVKINERDTPEDRVVQVNMLGKITELETLLNDLKVNNNSTGARLKKWFNINLDEKLRPHVSIITNEKTFLIGISPLYFNLNVKKDIHWVPENKVDAWRYDKLSQSEDVSLKNSSWLVALNDIDKYIKAIGFSYMYSKALAGFVHGFGLSYEFKFTKKLFTDEETTQEVLNLFQKELIIYLNNIKINIELGKYNKSKGFESWRDL